VSGLTAGSGPKQDATPPTTVVHLLRHGEVDNPRHVLYGRLPGYHLSELGRRMASRVAESVADREIVHIASSPLERALETAEPIAQTFGLTVKVDDRLIEAQNVFEGLTFGVGDGALRRPTSWWHLRNPFRPSWGEPYREIVVRMLNAMADARRAAEGRESLLVSHQLPIWVVRSYVEGRRLWHDPRKRQCSLASLTSFRYEGERLVGVTYSEPAADLLPSPGSKRRYVPGA
jgi:broad specificity phosphatase PhoE